jgi:mRNA-degrading endonuclease toxin of MazEF toxin-antitoxin module
VTFLKNFANWFNLKPKLDEAKHKPPLVSEGQIWWCHFGENIGSEISGKGNNFTRPGIIFKKLSHYTFLVVPTSTKIRAGSWYVDLDYQNIQAVACLHQIRVVDYRRIQNFITFLDHSDFEKVKQGFTRLYAK